MMLLELAALLNAALEFDRTNSSHSGVGSTGQVRNGLSRIPGFRNGFKTRSTTSLLQALRARLGDTPEALNKLALILHCVQATRGCRGFRQPMLAELISTILGYFMSYTVPPRTRGLISSRRRHPLLKMVIGDPVFAIVRAEIAAAALHPARVGISTVIAVLRDTHDEHIFRAKIVGPLTLCIAESGLDVMTLARTPEIAASFANAVPGPGKCRMVDFPMIESRLGLTGISLRCFSRT